MTTETLATIEKMLETLPENAQQQVVEHLREYISEMQSEWRWERLYKEKQNTLEKIARQAKQQIAENKAQPLNIDDL
jgi:hypothetical protein